MALINSGQIELLDLTDTRAAILNLTTSLPKIQVQTNDGFNPDFIKDQGEAPDYDENGLPKSDTKRIVSGLHIIPNLYFGQELISVNTFYENIIYKIAGETYRYDKNLEITSETNIYVNNYGELVYKKNLQENDNLFITAEIEKYDVGMDYYEDIQGQVEIVKVATANFLPIINYDKNIFSSYDDKDITLTAILYRDGQEYIGEITYKWEISPEVDGIVLGTEKTQIISRNWINNLATVFCTLSVKENNKTYEYKTQVTISDKTDPLFSQIISSKGIAFTGSNEETELTCDVYRGTTLLDSNITYSWFYFTEEKGEFVELTNESYKTKTINVIPQDYNASSVTFRCIAIYAEKETTIAQTAILISPEIRTIINPTQIFIPTLDTGALPEEQNGSFIQSISFKLTDAKGNILSNADKNELTITPVIKLNEGEQTPFEINTTYVTDEMWDYIITIKFTENEDFNFSKLETSTLFTIEYLYRGIELSDEFYIIKNIQGIQGESGDEVIETIQEYTLGEYETQTGFSYDLNRLVQKEVEGKGLINYYVEINGKIRYIFDENGALSFDSEGNILEYDENGNLLKDKDGNQIFFKEAGDIAQRKVAILEIYQNSLGEILPEWSKEIPFIPYNSEETPDDAPEEENPEEILTPIETKKVAIGEIDLTKSFFIISFKVEKKTSLWIRNHLFWSNGEETYSEPQPSESMRNLKLSSSYAETLYTNNSIQSIVGTQNWYDGLKDTISVLQQTDSSFEMKFISNNDLKEYIRFKGATITLGKEDKEEDSYATLIDNEGFYTLYLPKNTDSQIKIGAFDNRGLNTKEISLTIGHEINEQDSIVISKGTPTGGWVWTKGSRREN